MIHISKDSKTILSLSTPQALVNHYGYLLRRDLKVSVRRSLVGMTVRLVRHYRKIECKLCRLREGKFSGISGWFSKRAYVKKLKAALNSVLARIENWFEMTLSKFGVV